LDGKNYNTDYIIVRMLGLESRLYFDKEKKMLMESSPMGITMRRESLDKIADLGKSVQGLKIYETYAIYPEGRIEKPRKLTHLVIEISGITSDYEFLNNERQQYANGKITVNIKKPRLNFSIDGINREEFENDLASTPFMPCDDTEIAKIAQKITKGSKDKWESVEDILDWVYENIRKAPTFSIPYAKEVLSSRVGDCNEHAVLFAALVRSLGIPAKVVVGIVYVDGAFYYHAWNEVYWGRWVACDPVFGQHLADATHLKLEEGTLLDFIKVIKLVGQISIRIIESN